MESLWIMDWEPESESMRLPLAQIIKLLLLCCLPGWLSAPIAAQERRESRDDPAHQQRLPISLDGGASINPEVLQDVEDQTLGLTYEDREAYFRILKLTEKVDPVKLATYARELKEDRRAESDRYRKRPLGDFPTFVDLFRHPEEYRGQPVTLHGYFRRLVTYPAGKNDQGFEQLYEGWLYTDDSQGNPAVVIFTEKPPGFPIGGDITEEVTVTGYFLKMYGYAAQDTNRKAPLILSQTVRWRPQRGPANWTPSPQAYLALSAGVIIIGVLIAWQVGESRQRVAVEMQARRAKYDDFLPPVEAEVAAPAPAIPSRNGSQIDPQH